MHTRNAPRTLREHSTHSTLGRRSAKRICEMLSGPFEGHSRLKTHHTIYTLHTLHTLHTLNTINTLKTPNTRVHKRQMHLRNARDSGITTAKRPPTKCTVLEQKPHGLDKLRVKTRLF